MKREVKKCAKRCLKHYFYLKPINQQDMMCLKARCSFCISHKKYGYGLPFFNKDRKYFTSSFVLPGYQENNNKKQLNYRLKCFKQKIKNHQEKTEIFFPKPSKRHSKCGICKFQFEDYEQHIFSIEHKQQMKKLQINNEILTLCRLFGNNNQNKQENLQDCALSKPIKLKQQPQREQPINPSLILEQKSKRHEQLSRKKY